MQKQSFPRLAEPRQSMNVVSDFKYVFRRGASVKRLASNALRLVFSLSRATHAPQHAAPVTLLQAILRESSVKKRIYNDPQQSSDTCFIGKKSTTL